MTTRTSRAEDIRACTAYAHAIMAREHAGDAFRPRVVRFLVDSMRRGGVRPSGFAITATMCLKLAFSARTPETGPSWNSRSRQGESCSR